MKGYQFNYSAPRREPVSLAVRAYYLFVALFIVGVIVGRLL